MNFVVQKLIVVTNDQKVHITLVVSQIQHRLQYFRYCTQLDFYEIVTAKIIFV